jgi:outer membrane lipoprotein SlyB
MGTLRIKRGTKTALQTSPGYTPVEGELVYTTDTKEVFVGDGTTTGGTPVSVASQNLEDLGNVQALTPIKDQILVYNGSNWAATGNPALDIRGNIYGDDSTLLVDAINGQIVGPINTTSIVSSGNIVGNLVGDVVGGVTGNLVGNTTGAHYGNVFGTLDGDMTGSLFADDSTLVVSGTNGAIHSSVFTPNGSSIEIETPNEAATSVEQRIISQDNDSILTLTRKSASDLSASSATLGTISFQVEDSNGAKASAIILGNKDSLYLMADSTGAFSSGALAVTLTNGKLAVGGFGPATEKLDVVGNIKASGSIQPGVYADNTARDAAITSPVAGMIVFNTTGTKFQGYTGSAWVDLN